jgi:ornithine cyclodeaminase/alanine dehydrogenase-like protein (mu-crystallin family)
MTLLIAEEDVRTLLSTELAIPVIEESFRMAGEHTAENVPRLHLFTKKGYMKIGPGALYEHQAMGFKVVANAGASTGLNMLFSTETGELLAIVQSNAVSLFRTSAVAAVAIKHLSPPDVDAIGLYGAGRQAEAHLIAASLVRPIRKAFVYSRTPANREAFARKMTDRLGYEVVAVDKPEIVAQSAKIVMAVTNTEAPVVFGKWFTQPALIISAGANHWYERELDEKIIEMAKLVVVDDREHAKVECGDLKWAIDHGIKTWDQVENIGDVLTGRVKVPDFSKNTIVFESQGLGIHDVAISVKAYQLAKSKGLGQEINLTGKANPKQVVRS